VVVASREKRGTARGAEREGRKSVAEAHTASGQPVHVGRREPGEARALPLLALNHAHRVPALIIGVDKEEVGLALSRVQGSDAAEHKQPNGCQCVKSVSHCLSQAG